jgi:AraC-like DNA-binding protein
VYVQEFSGEELEQIARESFMPVVAQTRPDFKGRMVSAALGDALMLTRAFSGGPMRTMRTDRMASRSSTGDLLMFCVHVAGRGHVQQHERFAQLSPGSAVLYEANSAWELVSPSESQSLTLHFSRDMIPMRTADVTEACARILPPGTPGMQLLSGYLGQLYDLVDSLTASQRLDAGQAALDLLLMALRGAVPSDLGSAGSPEVLLGMMRTHVREHLSDPRLDVPELARRCHVSVRKAYDLFAGIGTTPGAYIREERLLAAQTLLSDARYDALGITGVGAAVGIRDLRTFERAFRRQYAVTPAAWRREHRAATRTSR